MKYYFYNAKENLKDSSNTAAEQSFLISNRIQFPFAIERLRKGNLNDWRINKIIEIFYD